MLCSAVSQFTCAQIQRVEAAEVELQELRDSALPGHRDGKVRAVPLLDALCCSQSARVWHVFRLTTDYVRRIRSSM